MRRAAALLAGVLPAATATAAGQTLELVSVADDGSLANDECYSPCCDESGRLVVFSSLADDLVPNDGNQRMDVFLRDRVLGTTIRVSEATGGGDADGDSYGGRLSGDGRFVVFASSATNLVVRDLNLRASDVFLRDLAAGTTTLISRAYHGGAGNGDSRGAEISIDGGFVAFLSNATNLVQGDTLPGPDVFRWDRTRDVTEAVSVATDGTPADLDSRELSLSGNGRFVAFDTRATNLDPTDTDPLTYDVYLRDMVNRRTILVGVNDAGAKADSDTFGGVVSDDGRFVAFVSSARNLAAGTDNGTYDVFVRDLLAGTTRPADVDSDGNFGQAIAQYAFQASISGDGQLVAFVADDHGLIPADHDSIDDVFLHDFATPLTSRQDVTADGTQADDESLEPRLSRNGRFVVFTTLGTNLAAQGGNGFHQVYVRERPLADATTRSYGAGWPGTLGVPSLTAASDPVVNRDVTLQVGNSRGGWTFGLVLIGVDQVRWPTGFGGDLLVDPLVTAGVAIGPGGGTFGGEVPAEERLVGFSVATQVLELDPGASEGISFTPGLQLVFGY